MIVPAGKYLSGPLFLRSNIVFEVCSGAVIYFHNDIANTPAIMGSWEGINRRIYASLFTGHDLENVTITGRGQIDGPRRRICYRKIRNLYIITSI